MDLVERFINYTKFDTQSAEDSQTVPSTPKQLIFAQYLKKELEDEGLKDALITSAFPLDDVQLAPLVKKLEAHFGCRLQPRVEVDPLLIGGVMVAVGDRILDASVRGKLDAMATALKN